MSNFKMPLEIVKQGDPRTLAMCVGERWTLSQQAYTALENNTAIGDAEYVVQAQLIAQQLLDQINSYINQAK